MASITYADVDAFVRSFEAIERRPGTVRNAFYVLKMVLDFAVKDARIKTNPCQGVELPSPASPEMLFLTGREARALAAVLDVRSQEQTRYRHTPPPYGLLVEFAAFTGLRAGETGALRIGNVDLQAGTVFVNRSASVVKGVCIEGEPKTGAGRRTVFLNRALGDRLRAHLGDRLLDRGGHVFAAEDGRPLNYGTFYSLRFKPALRDVFPERLHKWRFHDLRHTYASLLVEKGAHPKEMVGADGPLVGPDHARPLQPHHAAHGRGSGREDGRCVPCRRAESGVR